MNVKYVTFHSDAKLPYGVFTTPHMSRIISACMIEAPNLRNQEMVVTSVWRESDNPSSYHEGLGDGEPRAVDIRTGISGSKRDDLMVNGWPGALVPPITNGGDTGWMTYLEAEAWSKRIEKRLGCEYDVVYGLVNDHVNHIHIEHDYRKEVSTA